MSNFITHKIIKVIPWINNVLKKVLNKQYRLFRNYKKHGFQLHDNNRVDAFRKECNVAIQKEKDNYLKKLKKQVN